MDDAINYNTDMNDPTAHVNDSGSKKLTKYIGDYITKKYKLPDHRNDAEYADYWNNRYNSFISYKESRIKEQTSLDNALMLQSDKNIDSYIFISKGCGFFKDRRMVALLKNISPDSNLEIPKNDEEDVLIYFDNKHRSTKVETGEYDIEDDVGSAIYSNNRKRSMLIYNESAIDLRKTFYSETEDEYKKKYTNDITIVSISNIDGMWLMRQCHRNYFPQPKYRNRFYFSHNHSHY